MTTNAITDFNQEPGKTSDIFEFENFHPDYDKNILIIEWAKPEDEEFNTDEVSIDIVVAWFETNYPDVAKLFKSEDEAAYRYDILEYAFQETEMQEFLKYYLKYIK